MMSCQPSPAVLNIGSAVCTLHHGGSVHPLCGAATLARPCPSAAGLCWGADRPACLSLLCHGEALQTEAKAAGQSQ